MPGQYVNQVIEAYREWVGTQYHPDKVILVTCSREDKVSGVGHIYGPRSLPSAKDIVVKGLRGVKPKGSCFAITAKYDGLETLCYGFIGQCEFGTGGTNKDVLSFKRVGQQTDLSATQYKTLVTYAIKTTYEATIPGR